MNLQEERKIRVVRLPYLREILPVACFVFVLIASILVYKNREWFVFSELFGMNQAVALNSSKKCGINLDPVGAAGDPGGGTFQGVGWVRLVFKSFGGAPGLNSLEDSFNFYDSRIDSYTGAGANVLLILNQETYWGCGPWNDIGCTDQYASEFADKAREIASHYAGRVAAYEIWNEPDLSGSYVPPEVLGPVANAVVPAIRGADSSAYVVLGGFGSGPSQIKAYINTMGITVSVDAVSGHPYGQGAGGINGVFGIANDYIDALRSVGVPIWISEFGLQCEAGSCDISADYLKAFYNEVNSPVMIWYCWSDGMNPGFGIVDSGSSPKEPLYSSFYEQGCDSEVTLPQPGGGGIPKGEGVWTGPGGGMANGTYSCPKDIMTDLCPESIPISPSPAVEVSFKNIYANDTSTIGMITSMTIQGLSIAGWGGNLSSSGTGDNPQSSFASRVDKTWSYNNDYKLKSNYPAEGEWYARTTLGIAAQHGGDGRVQEGEGLTGRESQDVRTDEGDERTGKFWVNGLGTMLGAVPLNPYNYTKEYDLIEDFKKEGGSIVYYAFDTLQAGINHLIDALKALLQALLNWLGAILGLDAAISARDPKIDVSCGSETPTLLDPLKQEDRTDMAAGETDIIVGDFWTEAQSCAHVEEQKKSAQEKVDACEKSHNYKGIEDICDTNKCTKQCEELGDATMALNHCRGDARVAKIKGKIATALPYLPILSEAYKAVQIASSPSLGGSLLCSNPRVGDIDELTAATLNVHLEFYDKAKCGGPSSACTSNLSTPNPSFESGETWAVTTVAEDGRFSDGFGGVLNVPTEWASWHQRGCTSYGGPGLACENYSDEEKSAYARIPEMTLSTVPERQRVDGGKYSAKVFVNYGTYNAGLFQVLEFDKDPGSITFNASVMMWSQSSSGWDDMGGEAACSSVGGQSFVAKIGIYRGEITSAQQIIDGTGIEWSGEATDMDVYNDLTKTISSNGSKKFTFILQSANKFPENNNDTYWDAICISSSNTVDVSNATPGYGLESPLNGEGALNVQNQQVRPNTTTQILADFKKDLENDEDSLEKRYMLDFVEKYKDDLECKYQLDNFWYNLISGVGDVTVPYIRRVSASDPIGAVLGQEATGSCVIEEESGAHHCTMPTNSNSQSSSDDSGGAADCVGNADAMVGQQDMEFKVPGMGYLPFMMSILDVDAKSPDQRDTIISVRKCSDQERLIGDLGWFLIDRLDYEGARALGFQLMLEPYEVDSLRGYYEGDTEIHCSPQDLYTIRQVYGKEEGIDHLAEYCTNDPRDDNDR